MATFTDLTSSGSTWSDVVSDEVTWTDSQRQVLLVWCRTDLWCNSGFWCAYQTDAFTDVIGE